MSVGHLCRVVGGLCALLVLVACSRAAKENATVRIEFPKFQKNSQYATPIYESVGTMAAVEKVLSGWGLPNAQSISELNCFAVFIGGPDPSLSGSTCYEAGGAGKFNYGVFIGMVAAGESVSLSVPSGANRLITVVGAKLRPGQTCQKFGDASFSMAQYSNPIVIGQAQTDLIPGDNYVNIVANLGSFKLGHCSQGVYAPTCRLGSPWNQRAHRTLARSNYRYLPRMRSTSAGLIASGNLSDGWSGRWITYRSTDGASWLVADEFQLVAGAYSAAQTDAVASDGRHYVTGSAQSESGSHFVTRMTADGGASWQTVDNVLSPTGTNFYPMASAADLSGGVAVVFQYYDPNLQRTEYKIRYGQGVSWSNVYQVPTGIRPIHLLALSDRFVIVAQQDTQAGRELTILTRLFAASSDSWAISQSVVDSLNPDAATAIGNTLFIAGMNPINGSEIVIRKSADLGASWTDVFAHAEAGSNFYIRHLVASVSGRIAGVGYRTRSGENSNYFALASSDSGASWSAVVSTQNDSSLDVQGAAMTSDGAVIVASAAWTTGSYTSVNHQNWMKLTSANQWSTLGSILNTPNEYRFGRVYQRADGLLVFAGTMSVNGISAWTVEVSRDEGRTWTMVDQRIESNGSANPNSVAFGPSGSIAVVGSLSNTAGSRTISRVSMDGGVTWKESELSASWTMAFVVPAAGGFIAVSVINTSPARRVVQRTADGGASWTLVSDTEVYNSGMPSLIRDGQGRLVFVQYESAQSASVSVSVDDGVSWAVVGSLSPPSGADLGVTLIDSDGSTWYVGLGHWKSAQSTGGYRVLRSTDAGQTWSEMLAVETTVAGTSRYLQRLMVGPSGELTVSESRYTGGMGSTAYVLFQRRGDTLWSETTMPTGGAIGDIDTQGLGLFWSRSGQMHIYSVLYDGSKAWTATNGLICAAP
ncbi:MAG: exo-alpha-sialidase [Bdellovibrionaceae bacterium]|nr:exo-alpha-sialidase [Pseudobdellovibrionaceae bacterium]